MNFKVRSLAFVSVLFSVSAFAGVPVDDYTSTVPASSDVQNVTPADDSVSSTMPTAVTDSSKSASQMIVDSMNNTPVFPGKTIGDHFTLSGMLNFDAFYNSEKGYLTTEQAGASQTIDNGSDLALSLEGTAQIDAQANDWISAHLGVFYATQVQPVGISGTSYDAYNGGQDDYSLAPTRYYPYPYENAEGLSVEELYAKVGNANKAPVSISAGLKYLPFGRYNRYQPMPSLTQQLTELRDPAVEVEFVQTTGGLYASGYLLNGLSKIEGSSADVGLTNFGFTAGFARLDSPVRYSVAGYYLNNLSDVGNIAQFLSAQSGYHNRVGAWGADAMVGSGPFGLGVQYVSAIGHFNVADLAWQTSYASSVPTLEGASPSAFNIVGSYDFKFNHNYNSKLAVSYQRSDEAQTTMGASTSEAGAPAFTLPKERIEADYAIQVLADVHGLPDTVLGFEVNRDRAFSINNGGTGNIAYTAMVRLSVIV